MTTKIIILAGVAVAAVVFMVILGKLAEGKPEKTGSGADATKE